MRSGFYDSATDGRNPLVNQTGPAQSWQYGIGLNGTLINERASFSFNFNGQDSYSTPVAYAATPFGQVAGNIPLRSPADNYFYNGGVDYALTRDQVLRVNFQGSQFNRGNVGIGSYDLPERAYTAEDSQFGLFLQQNGPDRTAVRAEYAALGVWQRLGVAVSRRSAHHRRQRRVHERRSAAAGRHARAELLDELGSRLRARHPLDARRHRGPGGHLQHRCGQQLSRHLRLREPRGVRGAHAAQLQPPDRRSRGFATTTSRAASTSRTTSRSARA